MFPCRLKYYLISPKKKGNRKTNKQLNKIKQTTKKGSSKALFGDEVNEEREMIRLSN